MTTVKEQQRIAIVGGGPGGLTLALILQRHGIQTVVYEREASRESVQQGGSLDCIPSLARERFKKPAYMNNSKRLPGMKAKISVCSTKLAKCT